MPEEGGSGSFPEETGTASGSGTSSSTASSTSTACDPYTGTSSTEPYPGHLVDFVEDCGETKPVYAIYNWCDDEEEDERGCIDGLTDPVLGQFQGRFIDGVLFKDPFLSPLLGTQIYPVYEVFQECCDYPISNPHLGTGTENWEPDFIEVDCLDYPLSRHLLVRVTSNESCHAFRCAEDSSGEGHFVEGTLTWNGSDWVGTVLGLTVAFGCTGGSFSGITLGVSGCDATIDLTAGIKCFLPFHLTAPQVTLNADCCDCQGVTSARVVSLDLYGYCDRRHPARLVDYVEDADDLDGGTSSTTKPVYFATQCCPTKPCPLLWCCDEALCDIVSANTTLSGACTPPAATLFLGGEVGFTWANLSVNMNGHVSRQSLRCNDFGTSCPTFDYVFSCEPNCEGVVEMSPEQCQCTGEFFDVEFDVSVSCGADCGSGFPVTCCCDPGGHAFTASFSRL